MLFMLDSFAGHTSTWRRLEINGGVVTSGSPLRLTLPAGRHEYADAQIDDYGGVKRRDYPWQPDITLSLQARFSHLATELVGTAGFGFWNAPFGDPTMPWPTLPQAIWFFYASPPNDLPLAPHGPGRGWFASTLDATTAGALMMAPLAPAVLLLNQITAVRQRLWPWVQQQLGISFTPIKHDMTVWHDYRLAWRAEGSRFWVDGQPILQTKHSPRGPLGFVCWLDNQYMVATANGRFRSGTLPVNQTQWLEIKELKLAKL